MGRGTATSEEEGTRASHTELLSTIARKAPRDGQWPKPSSAIFRGPSPTTLADRHSLSSELRYISLPIIPTTAEHRRFFG